MGDRYAGLAALLAEQPAAATRLTVTFAELEARLGWALPPAARAPHWWQRARRDRDVSARAGWRRGRPHLTPDGWAVTFERVPPASAP